MRGTSGITPRHISMNELDYHQKVIYDVISETTAVQPHDFQYLEANMAPRL